MIKKNISKKIIFSIVISLFTTSNTMLAMREITTAPAGTGDARPTSLWATISASDEEADTKEQAQEELTDENNIFEQYTREAKENLLMAAHDKDGRHDADISKRSDAKDTPVQAKDPSPVPALSQEEILREALQKSLRENRDITTNTELLAILSMTASNPSSPTASTPKKSAFVFTQLMTKAWLMKPLDNCCWVIIDKAHQLKIKYSTDSKNRTNSIIIDR